MIIIGDYYYLRLTQMGRKQARGGQDTHEWPGE